MYLPWLSYWIIKKMEKHNLSSILCESQLKESIDNRYCENTDWYRRVDYAWAKHCKVLCSCCSLALHRTWNCKRIWDKQEVKDNIDLVHQLIDSIQNNASKLHNNDVIDVLSAEVIGYSNSLNEIQEKVKNLKL